jgi:hypothetical protein
MREFTVAALSEFRRASDTNQMTKAIVSDIEVIWQGIRFIRALKLDGISALGSDVRRVPDADARRGLSLSGMCDSSTAPTGHSRSKDWQDVPLFGIPVLSK